MIKPRLWPRPSSQDAKPQRSRIEGSQGRGNPEVGCSLRLGKKGQITWDFVVVIYWYINDISIASTMSQRYDLVFWDMYKCNIFLRLTIDVTWCDYWIAWCETALPWTSSWGWPPPSDRSQVSESEALQLWQLHLIRYATYVASVVGTWNSLILPLSVA